jgi:uncharacterized protein YuzE
MKRSYLEVTYRKGKPLAAYLYLPRREGERAARTQRVSDEFNIDLASDGRPIGVEILAPRSATLAAVNSILSQYQVAPVEEADLAPLSAA